MGNPPENAGCFWWTGERWFQIFLALFAVAGSLSGAYLGGWMASNAYQEQQKFDKQSAAQQLSIEIDTINQSLQTYWINN